MTKGTSSSGAGSGASSSNNSSGSGGYTTTSSGTNDQVCYIDREPSNDTDMLIEGQPLLLPRLWLRRFEF
jgi:hypothetical protein